MQSKIDLFMQSRLKTMEAEGMDRLVYQYAGLCKSVMNHPEKNLSYWLGKK
ncbi:hypothetical protein [Undibacterium griseum]|uniref:Uncharacterized protein n=1 Tax=Undibacterium griseum TaxID=2762295 RepID=A0ABR6YKW4_9BURK|nr:hypothetical protein [Undibacterium griseum]MBC3884504.1 hypothetical protein [Undibacterium griseum]